MLFDQLGLADPLLRAVRASGYTTPTPIQAQAVPPALERRDIFGCAQTGTGKTAAFVLPILQHLDADGATRTRARPARCLILTPTRELAAQIGESINTYGAQLQLDHAVVYGGVGQQPQERAIRRGLDILVACPGRLLDLMQQGVVDLGAIEYFVLDEADRMLDMGFINDVRRIIAALRERRQTFCFSATVPTEIRELADGLLVDPVHIAVTPTSSAATTVEQSLYRVGRARKLALLEHLLKHTRGMRQTLVFTRTKHGADRVAKRLNRAAISAEAIHGNKSQNARTRALDAFKAGRARVLVASDIAARGIDIDGITHVVNFELPHEPETYVHRIGRTGRAGNSGAAIAFCDSEEQPRWNKIQRLIAHPVDEVTDHPFHGSHLNEEPRPPQQPRQRNDQRRNANRSRQGARRGGGGGGGGSRSTSANGSRQRPR